MKNRWNDTEAEQFVAQYAEQGVEEDLALRVYTSRLIGVDPLLVAHGGGNTSVKTSIKDFIGQPVDSLCVKGSGWDLATIEPQGLPAVRLEPLHSVRAWDKLSDEDMVTLQRANLLDPSSPNPSVETLLHAYLPPKFVDHSHSIAILSLTNQPDGVELCKSIFGERVAIVPYVMPGFELAKVTADIYDKNADIEGLILHKHGLFTFGETAQESYQRHIDLVDMAEQYIQSQAAKTPVQITLPKQVMRRSEIAPIIRGACAINRDNGDHQRWIMRFRTSDAIRSYTDSPELGQRSQQGVITPDHNIRTKNIPLLLPCPEADNEASFRQAVEQALANYQEKYQLYFEQNNNDASNPKTKLDDIPRVILVPGVGLFTIGQTTKAADIAADLYELTIQCIDDAERIGKYQALPESDLFDMEYWSLEQAKLGKSKPLPLQGQVCVVTGGAGAIGLATAQLFSDNGAEVALLDVDQGKLDGAVDQLGGQTLGIECNVNDDNSVKQAINRVVEEFGGIDILVSNAGAAWQGDIGQLSEQELRESFELNFFAHQRLAQAVTQVMKSQGSGGCLLFNASKQAVNPGKNFGAYGLPKAATLFLSRQYALEYGSHGIRSNAINADRIRSGIMHDSFVAERAKARGVSETDYMAGNLLGQEVTAEDVAQAFLHQALALKTTGNVTTVDGGNIEAALR